MTVEMSPEIAVREGVLGSYDGLRIFHQRWLPAGAAVASLVLVHGYAEHSGRYDHVGRYFAARGIAVYALDHRGHGRSDGPRALVRSFSEYLADVRAFLRLVAAESRERPTFVLGHSMGGCITALWTVVDSPAVRGVVLSGPALISSDRPGQSLLARAITVLARVAPGLPLFRLGGDVSRDPAVNAAYAADPLVYHGRFKAGLAAAAARAMRHIDRHAREVRVPLLLLHGGADALTNPAGSQRFHDRVSSTDNTLRIYDGLAHEILNEPEQEQVMADIAAWIEARL